MTGRADRAGFTLVEVMTVTVLLTIFSTAALSLSAHMFGGHRLAQAYSDDLLGCQETLRRFTKDVRNAHGIEIAGAETRLHSAESETVYRLEQGELTRTDGNDRSVLARHVARFDVRHDRDIVGLELELGSRADKPGSSAVVATSVRMRDHEEVR